MTDPVEPLPHVGFGCWAIGGHGYGTVDDSESVGAVEAAWEMGIRLFDTADVYGFGHSETILSQGLGARRHDALIATKGGVIWDDRGRTAKDCSPAALQDALDGSLRRLGLDCIPLYQIHWPDGNTPTAVILETLEKFRQDGKVRWIGCSNFGPAELTDTAERSGFDTIQLPFNLIRRGNEPFMRECQDAGLRTLVYDVLARGLLADKFSMDTIWEPNDSRATDPGFQGMAYEQGLQVARNMRRIGDRLGKEPAQVALRWTIQTEAVDCMLVGCKTADQVCENAKALSWRLSPQDMAEIEALVSDSQGIVQ